MNQIGRAEFVIVIISDSYLRSVNCMYEMLELKNHKDLYNRIFPVVLKDAKIYEEIDRLDYSLYWDNKIEALKNKISTFKNPVGKEKAYKKINEYAEISRIIDEITDMLREMNTLSITEHLESDFSKLLEAINKKRIEDEDAAFRNSNLVTASKKLYYDLNLDTEISKMWFTYNSKNRHTSLFFQKIEGIPTLHLDANSNETAGLNLSDLPIKGSVKFDYLILEMNKQVNILFYLIPMQKRNNELIEVGSNSEKDPNNKYSPYRVKMRAKRDYNTWLQSEINYDFTDLEEADYTIFAPRINEGCPATYRGKMKIKNCYGFSILHSLMARNN